MPGKLWLSVFAVLVWAGRSGYAASIQDNAVGDDSASPRVACAGQVNFEIIGADLNLHATGIYEEVNQTCNGQPVYQLIGYTLNPRYTMYAGSNTWIVTNVLCSSLGWFRGTGCDPTDPTKCDQWEEYDGVTWQVNNKLLVACVQDACAETSVSGTTCQSDASGTYSLSRQNMWCSGRPVYRNRNCEFLSYVTDFQGWIVGPETCYNYGFLAVSDVQDVYPYTVNEVWSEYCLQQWNTNLNLRINCILPFRKGPAPPPEPASAPEPLLLPRGSLLRAGQPPIIPQST